MSETTEQLVNDLSSEILNPLIALLFAVALAYFVFGVVKFMANADNDTEREKGKQHILYSIIGLVIMAGVWGILNFLVSSLGVSTPEGFDQLN